MATCSALGAQAPTWPSRSDMRCVTAGAATDQGVFTGVPDASGDLIRGVGFAPEVTYSRNGNLQIAQFNKGAVQPSQVAAVSHGCPAAVFRGIRILNTAQEGA